MLPFSKARSRGNSRKSSNAEDGYPSEYPLEKDPIETANTENTHFQEIPRKEIVSVCVAGESVSAIETHRTTLEYRCHVYTDIYIN